MILKKWPRMADIAFLEHGARAAKAVARLSVTHRERPASHATAFLIGPDCVLTVHHALPRDSAACSAAECVMLFDYAWDANQVPLATVKRSCDMTTVIASADLDWAVLRLDRPVPKGFTAPRLGSSRSLSVRDPVYIIQHPYGERKKLAFPYEGVKFQDDVQIHYDVDTAPGSSGAPVFNEAWEVVAIHHRSSGARASTHEEPRNIGIRIELIIAAIRNRGVDLEGLLLGQDRSREEFYISAHPNDRSIVDKLIVHLSPLTSAREMTIWHRGLIAPGADIQEVDRRHLRRASVAIVVLSPDYLTSCVDQSAAILEHAKQNGLRVVPLLARPCFWELSGFAGKQPLPLDGRPLSQHPDADQAYVDTSRALGALLNDDEY